MWLVSSFLVDLACAERKEKSTLRVTLASIEFLFLVSAWACKWPRLNSPETYVESKALIAPSSTRTLRILSSRCWKNSVAYVTKAQVCGWGHGRQKLFRGRALKKSTATPR